MAVFIYPWHKRPLTLLLTFFAGGILVEQALFSHSQNIIPVLLITIALLLGAVFFVPLRVRIFILSATFFFAGILLIQSKPPLSRMANLSAKRIKVTIEGTLLEPAGSINLMARFKVRAHRLFYEGKWLAVDANIYVSVYRHAPFLEPGQKVRFPARLRPFTNFNNPGAYDYASAMKSKGYCCAASVSDGRRVVPMGPGCLSLLSRFAEKVRKPVRHFIKERLDQDDSSLFQALILGERQTITPGIREHFNRTGLGHLLAVSGLHIGLVAGVCFFIFRKILSLSYRLTLAIDIKKAAAVMTCFPVAGYAFLAGFEVSSQRAMIMVLAFLFSLIIGREKDVWSTIALAGLIILATDPQALFSISFQLSFCAVIGIVWLTPSVMSKITAHQAPRSGIIQNMLWGIFYYLIGLVAVSLCATIFLFPVTSFYFHRISLVAVPANIGAVPLLGIWVLPIGLLSVLALPFSYEAASALLTFSALGLRGMMSWINYWSCFSWASLWALTPNLFEIGLFYLLVLALFFCKRRLWARVMLPVVFFVIIVDAAYWVHKVRFNRDLIITFIDVGQGNAALVEFPGGKKMIIDGGGFSSDHFDVGRMVVAPFLWQSKIMDIDYVVMSHPQADHMNGLRFIAENFHPEEFWYNGDRVKTKTFLDLMRILESGSIRKLVPADLFSARVINNVKVEVLYPLKTRGSTDLNNNSLVIRISFKGISFLFPGDIEAEGERRLVQNSEQSLTSQVLLSPHHGSKSSSSMNFLKAVSPEICIISCGAGNFFGFPHPQTLKRLKNIGCQVIRIDKSGATQVRVGAKGLQIRLTGSKGFSNLKLNDFGKSVF
jgi:competence protein ComEC